MKLGIRFNKLQVLEIRPDLKISFGFVLFCFFKIFFSFALLFFYSLLLLGLH
jgi:hypothetical protein